MDMAPADSPQAVILSRVAAKLEMQFWTYSKATFWSLRNKLVTPASVISWDSSVGRSSSDNWRRRRRLIGPYQHSSSQNWRPDKWHLEEQWIQSPLLQLNQVQIHRRGSPSIQVVSRYQWHLLVPGRWRSGRPRLGGWYLGEQVLPKKPMIYFYILVLL